MASTPAGIYQKEMHENLGYFATWLPADPIEIGDVGVFQGSRFRRLSSLEEMDIHFRIARGKTTQDIQYTSREGTQITADVGAAVQAVAKAEITIQFSRVGAFLFQCSALRQDRIDNLADVSAHVLKKYDRGQGKWQKDWIFIEAVHEAKAATIIVSEDAASSITLAANVAAPLQLSALGDPRVGVTVQSMRGRVLHVVAGSALRPLYACLALVRPLLGNPSVQPVRGATSEEPCLGRPAIETLLES
jgi:hypothetical protein